MGIMQGYCKVMVTCWRGQAPLQRHKQRLLPALGHSSMAHLGHVLTACIPEADGRPGHAHMACRGGSSAHLGQAGVGGVVDERLMHRREDDVETVQHRGRGAQDLHTQHERAPPAVGGTV